jgi:DNA-binding NarL/FixJ family response regulator
VLTRRVRLQLMTALAETTAKDRVPREEDMPVVNSERCLNVLILSAIRLLGEGLAQALGRDDATSTFGACFDLEDGLIRISRLSPDIVLLDAAFPEGSDSVGRILVVAPQVKVVVFAVAETSDNIITWAQAGVAGYIPRTAALSDVAPLLLAIMRDEQPCSAHVAAGLLRRLHATIESGPDGSDLTALPALTFREMQVIELIGIGLSNKDIARRLNIGLGTTKSHVHNLLSKLNIQRRSQAALWLRAYQGHPNTSWLTWSAAPAEQGRSRVY